MQKFAEGTLVRFDHPVRGESGNYDIDTGVIASYDQRFDEYYIIPDQKVYQGKFNVPEILRYSVEITLQ